NRRFRRAQIIEIQDIVGGDIEGGRGIRDVREQYTLADPCLHEFHEIGELRVVADVGGGGRGGRNQFTARILQIGVGIRGGIIGGRVGRRLIVDGRGGWIVNRGRIGAFFVAPREHGKQREHQGQTAALKNTSLHKFSIQFTLFLQ